MRHELEKLLEKGSLAYDLSLFYSEDPTTEKVR